MNAETFCEEFATFAEAPNGVQKLREMILQLAVQGKLVPQDGNDEPTSHRLDRLWAQNHYIPKQQSIGKEETPPNWSWVTIGDLLPSFQNGESSRGGAHGQPTVVLRLADIKNGEITFDDTREMLLPETSSAKFKLTKGDVLIVRVNGSADLVGRLILCRSECQAIYCDHFIRMKVASELIYPRFFAVLGNSTLIREQISRLFVSTAGQKTVNQGHISSLLCPIPPLAEQRRIVAKVDQLLGLCDELAARQAAQREARSTLVAATLDRLVSPSPHAEFPTHANRLRNHFDQLFDTATTIPQLRQTILQLAVQGKLVPQNTNDKPASELLKRVDLEREQLLSKKKIRRHEILGSVPREQIPFEIPGSWEWRYLSDLCFVITDGAHHTPQYLSTGVPFLSVKDVSSGEIDFSATRFIAEQAHRDLCKRCRPEFGDILLTKVGTTGIAVTVEESREFSIFVSLALLKFSQHNLSRHYLMHLINSPFVRKQSADNTQGVGNKNLVLSKINQFMVPIPPLAEQKRIVAKVTELLALCDALESKLTQAESASTNLLAAAVHYLLNATKPGAPAHV